MNFEHSSNVRVPYRARENFRKAFLLNKELHSYKMLRVLARSLAKAGRPVVVRISSIGVLEARRLFSVSTDSDSHEDFQPKKKVQAAPSSAELFPTIEKVRLFIPFVLLLFQTISVRILFFQIVSSHPVVLFMKGTPQQPMCGFSAQVVRLLNHHGEYCLRTPLGHYLFRC